MTNTWLMRRSVRSPDCDATTCGQHFVRVQAALHQDLDLAAAGERDGRRGRRVAVLGVDDAAGRRCRHRWRRPPRGCARPARPARARSAGAARPRARRAASRGRTDARPRRLTGSSGSQCRSSRANTSLRRSDDFRRCDVGDTRAAARRLDDRRAPQHAPVADACLAVELTTARSPGASRAPSTEAASSSPTLHLAGEFEAAAKRCACPDRAACARACPRSPRRRRRHRRRAARRGVAGFLDVERLDVARNEHQRLDLGLRRARVARAAVAPTSISSKVTLR